MSMEWVSMYWVPDPPPSGNNLGVYFWGLLLGVYSGGLVWMFMDWVSIDWVPDSPPSGNNLGVYSWGLLLGVYSESTLGVYSGCHSHACLWRFACGGLLVDIPQRTSPGTGAYFRCTCLPISSPPTPVPSPIHLLSCIRKKLFGVFAPV